MKSLKNRSLELNTQVVSPKSTLHSLTHDQNASNHHSGQHYKLYNWKIVQQLSFTPHGDAKILSSSTLVTRRKTSFSICLPCSKTYYLSYSIKKHDIINMADPSSMQECVSYMNLVMSLAHHSLCGSVVEHQSADSEGLGTKNFLLCPTLVARRKNIFLKFNLYDHSCLISRRKPLRIGELYWILRFSFLCFLVFRENSKR